MKPLKFITASLVFAGLALAPMMAQVQSTGVVKKKKTDATATKASGQVTERMQSFFDTKESSDANLEWLRVIYRSLDLKKDENIPLYYPEEPNQDGMNMFCIIMKLLANDEIAAYEYLDGKEIFTDKYRMNVRDMLDRFHILYSDAKGSNEKHPKFTIEESDVPSNEVLSYYIMERYVFDRVANKMKRQVEAVCPVLHRTDDFGGEAIKYPMFWVKMNDIRPFLAQQYVFTDDDNNVAKNSLDDYFVNNMYKGDIYKIKNLRNLSLMQMYPDPDDLKHAQDSIENRLANYEKGLWVPTREELQARAEKAAENDSTVVVAQVKKKTTASSSRAKSKRASNATESKVKQPKVKQTKIKANNSSSAVHSVRRRK